VGGKSIRRDGRLIGWPIMSLEFLRIPNFKKPSTSCQLEPSLASNTDVGSPLLRQSDRDPVLKLRKACPRCWRGLACARRAHSAAQEMAPSRFPRCVRTQLRFELRCIWRDPDKNSLSGPNCIRITTFAHSSCAGVLFELINVLPQRAASSSSSGASAESSPVGLNIAGVAATAVAAGSIAWYYHLYGPTAHAMTPAEEG